jgi:polysaccharide export outer membrane protein
MGATAFISLALVIGVTVGGCASSAPDRPVPRTLSVPSSSAEYAIHAGDFLSIRFRDHPDQNQKMVLVRNDGRITLPLVGSVQAEGVTPSALSRLLERKYTSTAAPQGIAVSIVEVYQNLVWVGGEVRKPGFVDYRPGLTATEALAQAGGASDSAAVDTCLVLQRTGREQYRSSRLNLLKALQEGDASADPILAPRDVLFIPKTAIVKVDAWVDQYIVKMIPTRFTANSNPDDEIGSIDR